MPETYNERQALQAQFKRHASLVYVSCMCCWCLERQMRDPEAHSIPAEFVELWANAVGSNSKANVSRISCRFIFLDAYCIYHAYKSNA